MHAQRDEEVEHLGGNRSRTAHRRPHLLQSDLLERGVSIGDGEPRRVVDSRGLEPSHQLLPDARHTSVERGTRVEECGHQLLRIVEAGDPHPECQREVVVEQAIGDVCRRQVGHAAIVGAYRDERPDPFEFRDQIAVGEFDSLRRSCRARGVDQRHHVRSVDGTPGGREIEFIAALPFEGSERLGSWRAAVDTDDVFQRGAPARLGHAIREHLVADHHAVSGVREEVGDLFGRRGVVDGEGRRTEVECRRVHEVELRPVHHHQPDRVATSYAERIQSRGNAFDPPGVFGPGDPAPSAGYAQRHHLRARGRGVLERLAQALHAESLRRCFGSHRATPPSAEERSGRGPRRCVRKLLASLRVRDLEEYSDRRRRWA